MLHLPRRLVLLIDDDLTAGGSVSLLASIGSQELSRAAADRPLTAVLTKPQSVVTIGELLTGLPQFSSKGQPE